MSYFATYDVKYSHTAFKNNLKAQGFTDCVTMSDGSCKRLPNTTVSHDASDVNTVSARFNAALAATSPAPVLEKVLYVPWTSFNLSSDTNC
jgi:hypothetical protein